VIMYADVVTRSMQAAMDETARRRERQTGYNEAHHIVPATIRKAMETPFDAIYAEAAEAKGRKGKGRKGAAQAATTVAPWSSDPHELAKQIQQLERDMREAAKELEFERAAELRDRIRLLREHLLGASGTN